MRGEAHQGDRVRWNIEPAMRWDRSYDEKPAFRNCHDGPDLPAEPGSM